MESSLVVASVISVALCFSALAQEHHHPPQDAEIHEKFYSNWMRPDLPNYSCCNKKDCYPAEAKFRDGFWYAKRREDGAWIKIPPEKIEQRRDSPDGRNHVCMSPPNPYSDEPNVFCFISGSGV